MKRVMDSTRLPMHTNSFRDLAMAGACLLSVLFAFCLGGCAGRDNREQFVPVAQHQARVRWEQATGDRIVADAIFSHDAGEGAAVVIGKHQAFLELLRTREQVRASGKLARPSWRGTPESAPHPLSDWVMLLEAWQAARRVPGEGRQELHTANFRVSFERAGGTLKSMAVRPGVHGSSFTVLFQN